MLSRRDLVAKLAAGTAIVGTGLVARASFGSVKQAAGTGRVDGMAETLAPSALVVDGSHGDAAADAATDAATPPPWELVSPLAIGSEVSHGWRVAGLGAVVNGSCVLTLENERGRSHRVHICRNDGSPQGLVYTDRFDLVAMNGGQGDLPTEESFGLAVAELAHVLAGNERRHEAIATALLPQAERVRLYSGDADRRLR